MYFGTSNRVTVMCPHFKGTDHGAECAIAMDIVRNIENADIKLCMSRHFEICPVYFTTLRYESSLRSRIQAY